MANIEIRDGDSLEKFVKATGAGTNGDPFIPEHLETNSAAILTSAQLIDDGIATVASAIPTKGMVAIGTDGTNARALKTDASGELQVDVLTIPNITIGAAIPAGSNVIGGVTQSGTWTVGLSAGTNNIGDVDVLSLPAIPAGSNTVGSIASITTSVTPGTAAANLGKAEDAAHSPGDVGVMALAVRNDAGTALAGTDGDYIPLSTDNTGALRVTGGGGGVQYTEGDVDATITGTAAMWEDTSNTLRAVSAANPFPVNIVAGAGSGGTAQADNSTFTAGTTSLTPIGGVFNDAMTDPTSGQASAVRITQERGLHINLRNASGVEIGTTSNPVQIGDAGGSLTVDGTVAATQSGTWNIGLNAGTNNIGDVDVLTLPSGTNAGATAKTLDYDTGAGTDTVTGFGLLLPASGGAVAGGTSTNPLRVDPTGTTTQPVSGTVTANAGTGTFTVSGTVTANAGTGNQGVNITQLGGVTIASGSGVVNAQTQRVTLATDVNVPINLAQAGGATIALNSGTASASTIRVAHATDVNVQTVGNVAHDAVDSGNPIKIGGVARNTNPTAVADGDRAQLMTDLHGRMVTTPAPRGLQTINNVTLSTTTETTILAAAGAGVFLDLTNLLVFNKSASAVDITIRSATAGSTVIPISLSAGAGLSVPISYPIEQAAANNNWTAQLSSAVTDVRITAVAMRRT